MAGATPAAGLVLRVPPDGVTDRPARSTGVGLLTVFAVPLVLLLVALTIVGIPLSLVGAVAFTVLVWVAVVYGQYALGVWALSVADRENRWLALVVGALVVQVLYLVPLLNLAVAVFVVALATGAIVGQWWQGRAGEPSESEPSQQTADS